MDIKKYLKKDVELSNEDVDIEGLTADLKKGVEKDITAKLQKQYETDLAAKTKEYTDKIASMQNDYDSLSAKYNTNADELKLSNLKNTILSNGFKGEDVAEVANLRTTMYKEITDDNEALEKVKERYGKVYFETNVNQAPNEPKMQTTPAAVEQPVITRNTSIKDLMKN